MAEQDYTAQNDEFLANVEPSDQPQGPLAALNGEWRPFDHVTITAVAAAEAAISHLGDVPGNGHGSFVPPPTFVLTGPQ